MKKNMIYSILCAVVWTLTGCALDNYEEPVAMLYGNLTYEGEPVGVRTNAGTSRIELWQDGFALREAIPIFVAQDGSYSVSLFEGEYKLVVKENGPWEASREDTLVVQVNGLTELDVAVTPFFTVNEETFEVSANNLTASFAINHVLEEANLDKVTLFFGERQLTDRNLNTFAQDMDLGTLGTDGAGQIAVEIPASLQEDGQAFIRIGVKSDLSEDYYYTQVQKVVW